MGAIDLQKRWGAVLAACAVLLMGVRPADAAEAIPKHIYEWVQSTVISRVRRSIS